MHCPVRASSSSGTLRRRVLRAQAASFRGSRSPAIKAASMRRSLAPHRSETTLERLLLVSSQILCIRFVAWLRGRTRATRMRVRSRKAWIAGEIKLGRINPWAHSSAIHCASALSVFLPGRCRISCGLPTTTSTVSVHTWETSLDSHEGLSTKIELTCATSIRRQDAGSCWRAKESAGTLCQNRPRAGEDDGRVFETGQSLPSRSDRWRRSRQ